MLNKPARSNSWFMRLFIGLVQTCLAAVSFCNAGEKFDKNKYIAIDEIQPGMKAYCLTTYKGTAAEKFDFEVISVVRNISPGRNAILVQSTDERFIHTGPVAGCSGSPVYIDGRLAGALAFAWLFSKDPIYGVTPIEEMLSAGKSSSDRAGGGQVTTGGFVFDFSKPIDFEEVGRQITNPRPPAAGNLTAWSGVDSQMPPFAGGVPVHLPCPLIASGLPAEVCEQLNSSLEPFGFMAVSGPAGQAAAGAFAQTSGAVDSNKVSGVKLAPGACLAVPLVSGDIKIEVMGTATEVIGDKVYGFGHGFLGYGPIDLPMATGQIYMVVPNMIRSFKFGSAIETVGALTIDEATAVCGQIGAKSKMIPLTIEVDRYNDSQKRTYNCQLAANQLLTPLVLPAAVGGAALMFGRLPPDHMIAYKVDIHVKDAETISFENVSTALGLMELAREGAGSVALLMNNPYERLDVESIDFDIRIVPKNIIAHIWSVVLIDSKVKAGKEVRLEIVIESYLGGKKKYESSLIVPEDLPPGKYDVIVMGGYEYREFLARITPYRFVAQNVSNLISVINDFLNIRKDRLYCVLVLPPGGVTVEKAELPDLPATKALVLADAKRTLKAQPYPQRIEKSLDTGTVIIDSKVMQITVEK